MTPVNQAEETQKQMTTAMSKTTHLILFASIIILLACTGFTHAICLDVCKESINSTGMAYQHAVEAAIDKMFSENGWNAFARANELVDKIFAADKINFFGNMKVDAIDHMFIKKGLDFWGKFLVFTGEVFSTFHERHLAQLSHQWQDFSTEVTLPFKTMSSEAVQQVKTFRQLFNTSLHDTFYKIDEEVAAFGKFFDIMRKETNDSITTYCITVKRMVDTYYQITDQFANQFQYTTDQFGDQFQMTVGGVHRAWLDVMLQTLAKFDEKMIQLQHIADTMQLQVNASTVEMTRRADYGLQLMQQVIQRILDQIKTLSSQWTHLFMLGGASFVLLTIFLHYEQKFVSRNDKQVQQRTLLGSFNIMFFKVVSHYELFYTLFMWAAFVMVAFESSWTLLVLRGIAQRTYGEVNTFQISLYSTIFGTGIAVYFVVYAALGMLKSCCQKRFKTGVFLTALHLVLATLLLVINGYLSVKVLELKM